MILYKISLLLSEKPITTDFFFNCSALNIRLIRYTF